MKQGTNKKTAPRVRTPPESSAATRSPTCLHKKDTHTHARTHTHTHTCSQTHLQSTTEADKATDWVTCNAPLFIAPRPHSRDDTRTLKAQDRTGALRWWVG